MGLRLFWPAAYSGALYGGRFCQVDSECTPYWYDLDDSLPGRCSRSRFLWYCLFPGSSRISHCCEYHPETVFMELTKILFNPWIAGIVLAAILAAVMSTLSCQLLVCSSTLTEDFYKSFLRKNASQKELVWVGRLMVLLIALLAIWMAGNPESKVL